MSDYNGWKNYQTWNVALWIREGWYDSAREFMKTYKGRSPYKDFAKAYELEESETFDGVWFVGPKLSYRELNSMMYDLRREN